MKKNAAWLFAGIGFELVGLVLGSIWLGDKVDKYFGWNGTGLIICLVASLFSWLLRVIFLLKKVEKDL